MTLEEERQALFDEQKELRDKPFFDALGKVKDSAEREKYLRFKQLTDDTNLRIWKSSFSALDSIEAEIAAIQNKIANPTPEELLVVLKEGESPYTFDLHEAKLRWRRKVKTVFDMMQVPNIRN